MLNKIQAQAPSIDLERLKKEQAAKAKALSENKVVTKQENGNTKF